MKEIKICPKQVMESRELVITGKKYNGCTMKKTLIAATDYDENGNIVKHYDGAETWWDVQKYDSVGMPVGRKNFGGDKEKAMKYFKSNNF